ncbi:YitT family protein [Sinisalibacter aestuarii]|uniref:Membrane protein n=1 Tax=Sinisalibacter aestuarii TaxID=2949426 RepID=A0ABQ5LYU7_9RHOB|nr:YitT family protein [Sinisalibacter aestuarii]GKY89808.1 membrane protein [Sinisalibacter aestuarii]
MLLLSAPPDQHTKLEDALAFVTGTGLVALSVQFLQASGLITGQIAGLSLVLSYVSGWSFGLVFFLLNLPFYGFALARMGWRFTVKTFLAVALLSGLTELMSRFVTLDVSHPALAALFAGITAGTGLLVLFRHGATLGGVGILALYIQDKAGIRAGIIQLGFDLIVFVVAVFIFPAPVVAWSLAGAVLLNLLITMNHRRDRYIAQ